VSISSFSIASNSDLARSMSEEALQRTTQQMLLSKSEWNKPRTLEDLHEAWNEQLWFNVSGPKRSVSPDESTSCSSSCVSPLRTSEERTVFTSESPERTHYVNREVKTALSREAYDRSPKTHRRPNTLWSSEMSDRSSESKRCPAFVSEGWKTHPFDGSETTSEARRSWNYSMLKGFRFKSNSRRVSREERTPSYTTFEFSSERLSRSTCPGSSNRRSNSSLFGRFWGKRSRAVFLQPDDCSTSQEPTPEDVLGSVGSQGRETL
jgi:hypothetical protein